MRAKVQIRARTVKAAAPLANARGAWSTRRHVLLTLVDPTGRSGRGEAAPLAGHSAETVEQAEAELSSLRTLDLPSQVPQDVSGWLHESSRRLRHPSARFAIEAAMLDWAGRVVGRSAASLLGAQDGEGRELCATIGGPPPTWSAQIGEALARGYRAVKLKVSPATIGPAARLADKLARGLPDLRVRLDANGSLALAHIEEHKARLRGIELFEEPLPGGQRAAGLPTALDESMRAPGWESWARGVLGGAAVIKPMAIGGIAAALEAAGRARAAGLRVVASYLWEGPIGWAASIAVGLAAGDPALAHGLGPHAQLQAWPPFALAAFQEPRVVNTPAPGLGLLGEVG